MIRILPVIAPPPGELPEGLRGALSPLRHHRTNPIQHTLHSPKHIQVPHAQHHQTKPFQISRAPRIMRHFLCITMRDTIHLDHHAQIAIEKIHDVGTHGDLAIEPVTRKSLAAKLPPQPAFSLGRFLAHAPRAGIGDGRELHRVQTDEV
jgi:hypothetical protein